MFSNSSNYLLKLEIDEKYVMPTPKSSLSNNKMHKLIKCLGFATVNHKILKNDIF